MSQTSKRHSLSEILPDVVETYRSAVEARRKPNLAIADKYGVPVPTARGWVQEARRRGLLPPGTQGRATGLACRCWCHRGESE